MNILSVYLSHNASMTISKNGKILEVLELERFINTKNGGGIYHTPANHPLQVIYLAKEYLMNRYNIIHFDLLLLNPNDLKYLLLRFFPSEKQVLDYFKSTKLKLIDHHRGHIACAFYQSNLQYSKGCSFDGGGNDGNFKIYECSKEFGIKEIDDFKDSNICFRYFEIGIGSKSIKQINSNLLHEESLVYPGKLMGLSSYGKVRNEWLPAFNEFYKGNTLSLDKLKILKSTLNLPQECEGQIEYDLAATSQKVFEDKFDFYTQPYYENEDNFILTGGGALNIINNQRLSKNLSVFVPPNPHDGGLSLGFMLDYLKPKIPLDSTYLGPEVWDKNSLAEYVETHNGQPLKILELIEDILKGKIIGIVRGRSELGPRALGNRSIICHAAIPNMKDKLNKKVKNREHFRPFAPVCAEETAPKFFNINTSSRWMSFCPPVKHEHQRSLKSITHVDGTARLQTVNSSQNQFLYSLLDGLAHLDDYPVLLNTSFNIAGKPILNTYKDAIWMLENTELDGVVLEDFYFKKN
jgi:carbamoyltransferase